jgi:hypothetical protein
MEPKFVIWIELITGEIVKAFTWGRDLQSGIDRARSEAREFGYANVAKVYGTKI